MEHASKKIMDDHHMLQQQQLVGFGCMNDLYDNTSSRMAGGKVYFTAAQLQELQRQTMIYKYMMASIPVPAELLMCLTTSSSNNNNRNLLKGSLELGYPSHNSDPEPWRCRRTDGKKWRCSRDVAPDQKYCERHSHKTRPRSRKPVEVHTATTHQQANNSSHSQMSPLQLNKDIPSLFSTVVSAAPQYDPQIRCHNLYMRGELNSSSVASPNQEWQQQMAQSKLGLKRDYLTSCNTNLESVKDQNLRLEPLGFEYGHTRGFQSQCMNDQCSLLLGPNLAALEGCGLESDGTQETRHFIDAWSAAERNSIQCSVSRELAVPSSLALSMSRGANQDQNNAAQFCLGTMGVERENIREPKTHWWLGSNPGGPLAEALCLGISSNSAHPASNTSSPYGRNNNGSSSKTSSGDGRGGLNLID